MTPVATNGDTRPVVVNQIAGPMWGYHFQDINLTLGNLVSHVDTAEPALSAPVFTCAPQSLLSEPRSRTLRFDLRETTAQLRNVSSSSDPDSLVMRPVKTRKDTSPNLIYWGSHLSPGIWTFGGGEGTRTPRPLHCESLALSTLTRPFARRIPSRGVAIPSGSLTIPPVPSR